MSSIALFLVEITVISVPVFGCGYVVGKGRGEDEGYKLGYHEGQFDERTKMPTNATPRVRPSRPRDMRHGPNPARD